MKNTSERIMGEESNPFIIYLSHWSFLEELVGIILFFCRVLDAADRYTFINTCGATIYPGRIKIQLPYPGVITSY